MQYKVSEAMSYGLPVVLSTFSASGLGLTRSSAEACTAGTPDEFVRCVDGLHENVDTWYTQRNASLEYIRRTHNEESVREGLGRAIE